MAGKIRALIDSLITLRCAQASGNDHFVRAHLILHGIHPDRYTERSVDDPAKIRVLEQMIADFRAQDG
jgi:hypothetical protein